MNILMSRRLNAMRIIRRWPIWWALLNVAGIALYLWLAADFWVPPGEEGLPAAPGDAFVWFMSVVPVVTAFLLLNIVTFIFVMRRVRSAGTRSPLYIWWAIAALWLAAAAYDFHRGYRVIDPAYTTKDYQTEFMACAECRVMYRCPEPKERHEVPEEAKPGAYWMMVGSTGKPRG